MSNNFPATKKIAVQFFILVHCCKIEFELVIEVRDQIDDLTTVTINGKLFALKIT